MEGGGKEITTQLNGVTKHPDGSIQNAMVCFPVSLQPGAVAHLKPQLGRSTVSTALNVSRVGDAVELKDGLVGARFQLGEKRFETPIRAHEVPQLQGATARIGAGVRAHRFRLSLRRLSR